MPKILLFTLLALFTTESFATDYDSLTKTGTIIHFKIRYENLGIPDTALLNPIHQQLTRLFKLDEVIDLNDWPVEWVGRYGSLQKKKKLKAEDREKVDGFAPRTDMIVSIRLDHDYNNILGGLLGGRRHVMWMDCTVFDRHGTVIWRSHKKTSCCAMISFNSNTDEDNPEQPLNSAEFMELFNGVMSKTFDKF